MIYTHVYDSKVEQAMLQLKENPLTTQWESNAVPILPILYCDVRNAILIAPLAVLQTSDSLRRYLDTTENYLVCHGQEIRHVSAIDSVVDVPVNIFVFFRMVLLVLANRLRTYRIRDDFRHQHSEMGLLLSRELRRRTKISLK